MCSSQGTMSSTSQHSLLTLLSGVRVLTTCWGWLGLTYTLTAASRRSFSSRALTSGSCRWSWRRRYRSSPRALWTTNSPDFCVEIVRIKQKRISYPPVFIMVCSRNVFHTVVFYLLRVGVSHELRYLALTPWMRTERELGFLNALCFHVARLYSYRFSPFTHWYRTFTRSFCVDSCFKVNASHCGSTWNAFCKGGALWEETYLVSAANTF